MKLTVLDLLLNLVLKLHFLFEIHICQPLLLTDTRIMSCAAFAEPLSLKAAVNNFQQIFAFQNSRLFIIALLFEAGE